jgi:chitinase
MVSAFGGTVEPTTAGNDAVATANWMAQWVLDYGLDGIDVDYEVSCHCGTTEMKE